MKNIFLDKNVVLDLFLERRPHHAPAQKVFMLDLIEEELIRRGVIV